MSLSIEGFEVESEVVGSLENNREVWFPVFYTEQGDIFRYETNAKDEQQAELWATSFEKRRDDKWNVLDSEHWFYRGVVYGSPAYARDEQEIVFEERQRDLRGEY
jgi:hypothetical protein